MASKIEQRKIEIIANGSKWKASLKDMTASARILENQLKKMQTGTKEWASKAKELRKVKDRIADVRTEMRSTQGAMGKLTGMLGTFAPAFLAAFALKDAFNKIKNFQQANANLAAVLGKTREETVALTDDAKRLGSQTAFTATQVSELQTEYAKLGFSENEILNVSEATLSLAAAVNTDLAQAATVAGSTLRAFNLDTSQTQRVVDVMAKSFSSSALDMEKFSTAMAAVAPVASSAGISVEKTTAMLGLLVDRGLDASTAGTSLRNIFLQLSSQGLSFEDAMQKINTAADKNAVSMELFGTRGATTATILADNADAALLLEEKLNHAGGAAKKMADEQLNTLEGKLKLVGSAWEGLILKIDDGDGVIGGALQGVLGFVTNAINGLSTLDGRLELMFNGVTGASKETVQQLIELGETASGSKVIDVINKTFEGVSNKEFIAQYSQMKETFISAFEAEGEARDDSNRIFMEYYVQRLAAYQNDVRAEDDARKAKEEAEKIAEGARLERLNNQKKERQEIREKEAEELQKQQEKLQSLAIDSENKLEDLKIGLMKEGLDKKLAQIDLAHEKELQKLDEQKNKVIAFDKISAEERQLALDEIEAQRKAFEETKKQAEELAKEEERQAKLEKDTIAAEFELENSLTEEEQKFMALQEQNTSLFALAIDAELQHELAKLDLLKSFLQQKLQLLQSAGQSETIEAAKIKNQILSIEKEKSDKAIEYETRTRDFKRAITDQVLSTAVEYLETQISLMDEESEQRKKAGKLLKAVQIAEVVTQGIREVQNIWVGASKYGPILGPIFGVIQTAAALFRSKTAIQKIQSTKYAGGGNTVDMTYSPVSDSWVMPDNTSATWVGTHKNGGWVSNASFGVIGEEGSEWVGPNWMIQSPKYANIFGYLENERRQGKTFAEGGSTTAQLPSTQPGLQDLQKLSFEIQRLQQTFTLYATNVETWQRKLTVINDPRQTEEALRVINQVDQDSSIRRG